MANHRTCRAPAARRFHSQIPLSGCGTRFRAVHGIEAPEKGSAGRRKWKAAEELWQEHGNAPCPSRAEKECAIFSADLSPPFQGGVARSAGVVLARITTPPPPAAPLLSEEGIEPKSIMPRRIAIVDDDAAIRPNYADPL